MGSDAAGRVVGRSGGTGDGSWFARSTTTTSSSGATSASETSWSPVPDTFSMPNRFAKHMMIVGDLTVADPGAVEDAIEAAWELQRGAG